MANKSTIDRMLIHINIQYANQRAKFSDEHLMVERESWHEEFKDVDDDVFVAAVKLHIRSEEFFPNIAAIVKQIDNLHDKAEGGSDWTVAWGAVRSAVQRYGMWGTTEEIERHINNILPPAMARDLLMVIKRLGFKTFCEYDTDAEPTIRAQFRDTFNQAHNGRVDKQRLPSDVQDVISKLAQSLDAKRLSAPKKTEQPHKDEGDDEEEDYGF